MDSFYSSCCPQHHCFAPFRRSSESCERLLSDLNEGQGRIEQVLVPILDLGTRNSPKRERSAPNEFALSASKKAGNVVAQAQKRPTLSSRRLCSMSVHKS
jgi:hypothetical protein